MYKCTECKSISLRKPDTDRRDSNCDFCGADISCVLSFKNTKIDVSSINYLFPPLEWPNHRDKFSSMLRITLGDRYYWGNTFALVLKGYRFTPSQDGRRLGRLVGPLTYQNWAFEFKVRYILQHPEFIHHQILLDPTDQEIPCLINNSFYAYLPQNYLLVLIINNVLNIPRKLYPIPIRNNWMLQEPLPDRRAYNTDYNTFTQSTRFRREE